MKKVLIICTILFSICQNLQAQTTHKKEKTKNEIMKENIYQFKVEDIEGNEFDFSTLKGKKIMVVNTASKCGLTPQYKDLQTLYDKYKDNNFVIVGFPANNFASQEPGNDEEIAAFCERNYGVTFPMMSKISVKGSDMDPIYKFLTQKEKNGLENSEVEWNFQKYLINEKGELENVISPRTSPTDASIVNWIENKE
ncbi:glutathione peroxidase [Flavobacterium sp. HNIBRBA15423]|uniref:glutathione peroxidase n=1 Tax=Flavobacterium sp. HNIBRBA15423 TaxID=3458683 RepID=UPI00404460D5